MHMLINKLNTEYYDIYSPVDIIFRMNHNTNPQYMRYNINLIKIFNSDLNIPTKIKIQIKSGRDSNTIRGREPLFLYLDLNLFTLLSNPLCEKGITAKFLSYISQ